MAWWKNMHTIVKYMYVDYGGDYNRVLAANDIQSARGVVENHVKIVKYMYMRIMGGIIIVY
jgi:hypothetical protein